MLDAFETRLADLAADALNGVAGIHLVTRARTDFASEPPGADGVAVLVHVENAAPDPHMGDDSRTVRGTRGAYRLQTVLSLAGQASIQLRLVAGSASSDLANRRRLLVRVLDRLLVAFHSDEVRSGRAFRADVDLGFELDGFRLARIAEPAAGMEPSARLSAVYDYSGRFWPVEVQPAGDAILGLPTRLAVLPIQIPENIRARAGGPDLEIPLRVDLRSFAGAPAVLAARLLGAAPPGSLIGGGPVAPQGWTGFAPDGEGITRVVYRPPDSISENARVRVATALARESGPTIPLAEFVIELSA